MSGEVRVVEDGLEQRRPQRSSPGPSWLWLIIGFFAGVGFAVVFVDTAPEAAEPAAQEPDFPTVDETTLGGPEEDLAETVQDEGIGGAVADFPDTLVAVNQVGGSGLEHLTWPLSGEVRREPIAGFSTQLVRFDVSGRFLALGSTLPESDGLLLSAGNQHRIWPVATDVTGFAWHDSETALLAVTQEIDGELLLQTVDLSAEPHLVTSDLTTGDRVAAWGDWGFAVQGEGLVTLLTAEGEHKAVTDGRALDSDPDGWIAVSDDGVKLVSSGGGVKRLDAPLELIGEIEGARFSPDGTKLVVTGGAGHFIVPVDDEGELIHAPVTSGFPQLAWSSDSRFVLSPWIRGVLVIDTERGGRSQTQLVTDTVVAVATIPLTSR